MARRIALPLGAEVVRSMRAGDAVLLTGPMYTARDAAHRRMIETLDGGRPLPFDIRGETLYYVGPSPAPPGRVVGSAGPTTSYRMDAYAPRLIEQGLRAMIGKGRRSAAVVHAMVRAGGVYLGATGGAAALIARSIVKSECIAYEDLGAEAIYRFEVVDFPATVIIDSAGNDLYAIGPKRYRLD